MQIAAAPFSITDFLTIAPIIHKGTTGEAEWRTFYKGNTRVRLVIYSPGYLADHWCQKGHIIYCIEGSMETELEDGRKFLLSQGMVYHVGDDSDAHRSFSKDGCKLFVVD